MKNEPTIEQICSQLLHYRNELHKLTGYLYPGNVNVVNVELHLQTGNNPINWILQISPENLPFIDTIVLDILEAQKSSLIAIIEQLEAKLLNARNEVINS